MRISFYGTLTIYSKVIQVIRHIIRSVGEERRINKTLKNMGNCDIFEAITDGEYRRSHQIYVLYESDTETK